MLSSLRGEDAERVFLSVPKEESALQASRAYAAKPHLAGTPGDYESALVQLKLYQEQFGITPTDAISLPVFDAGTPESRAATLNISSLTEPAAWIDTYYPLLDTPLEHKLEIIADDGSVEWSADLEEKAEEGDDTSKLASYVGAWHAFSKTGDVKGKLIYVSYGRKADFDRLVSHGVDFTGTIALARAGHVLRGLKVQAAQEVGCVGILIYTDPSEYGNLVEENGYKAWPEGPALNPHSVERGNVQFPSVYPGDPTTPGYPAYKNATRQIPKNLASIPSLPLSWSNAKRLLAEIGPHNRGEKSKKDIRLLNNVDAKITPIWNTMAVIPGQIKGEVVMMGNHRDGAGDPTSGTVSLHEVVRGLGELLKQGWKPVRTIVIASWDAEEYGLIGSTEWGEDFEDWIKDNVVAYLNLDMATAGSYLRLIGSPTLAHLLRKTAEDLAHPTDPSRTLWDARNDQGPFTEVRVDFKGDIRGWKREEETVGTGIKPLGSGSDYTVFLQRCGVASLDLGFRGTYYDAIHHYHSVYDSQRWQEVYGDPGFHRHVAIAKLLGLVTLRLADAIVLPLNTTQYSLELGEYLDKVDSLGSSLNLDPDLSDLREAIYELQAASAELDEEKDSVEQDFSHELEIWRSSVEGSIQRDAYAWAEQPLSIASDENMTEPQSALGSNNTPHPQFFAALQRVKEVNKKLADFEQGFISPEGMTTREWYKHLIVSPGKWLGYGATTFPGLTEALRYDQDVALAEYEASRATALITKLAASITGSLDERGQETP
ncbi:hypothetical protein BOTBODRAFT_106011 [Botryobasidium botryosum FD-172 SS1]|uniref:Zn-dependent exopeptidase n=1 Tax=Botryobasidium botryosum (strain FD-172 SS1) TaxID=930990 RepID=A0A067MN72_BOTB1|nr:hypothetical protein BOTBODRAFT_106011 [Botryobasidium botryosum FD-172 SS1]